MVRRIHRSSFAFGVYTALILFTVCPDAVTVGDSEKQVLSQNPPPPKGLAVLSTPNYGEQETTLSLAPIAAEIEELFPPLCFSGNLSHAASNIATALGQNGNAEFSQDFIDFAMWSAGCWDTSPVVLTVLTTESGTDNAVELLSRAEKSRANSFTHVGVARSATGIGRFHWAWVIILVERKAYLFPVSRTTLLMGKVDLNFRLDESLADARVVTTYPDGEISRYSANERNGDWHASVPAGRRAGELLIEVLADGRLGPDVVALFPIYVGVDGPTSWSRDVRTDKSVEPTSAAEAEQQLYELLCQERDRGGLTKLVLDVSLSNVARAHSEEMVLEKYLAHDSPNFGGLDNRLRRAGFQVRQVGENISRGNSIRQIHASLMQSPGHRVNILSRGYDFVGIGVAISKNADGQAVFFVTQDFCRRIPVLLKIN